jgi:hypothetical protein
MNEEANYCNQCGAKTGPEAKFCSSCGSALDGVNKENYEEKIQPSKADVGSSDEINIRGIDPNLNSYRLRKAAKLAAICLTALTFVYGLVFISFELKQGRLENELEQRAQKLSAKIKRVKAAPPRKHNLVLAASTVPASQKKIVTVVKITSDDGLCNLEIKQTISDGRFTRIICDFYVYILDTRYEDLQVQFDTSNIVHNMNSRGCGHSALCVKPFTLEGLTPDDGSYYYLKVKERERSVSLFQYDAFYEKLKSVGGVAFKVGAMVHGYEFYNHAMQGYVWKAGIKLGPAWIRFSLEGAKEAIAKLGKELKE